MSTLDTMYGAGTAEHWTVVLIHVRCGGELFMRDDIGGNMICDDDTNV